MAHSENVAAKSAVKEVFFLLGVDVDDAASIEDFRKDLRFGHSLRRFADHGMLGLISILVLGIATAFWAGVTVLVKK